MSDPSAQLFQEQLHSAIDALLRATPFPQRWHNQRYAVIEYTAARVQQLRTAHPYTCETAAAFFSHFLSVLQRLCALQAAGEMHTGEEGDDGCRLVAVHARPQLSRMSAAAQVYQLSINLCATTADVLDPNSQEAVYDILLEFSQAGYHVLLTLQHSAAAEGEPERADLLSRGLSLACQAYDIRCPGSSGTPSLLLDTDVWRSAVLCDAQAVRAFNKRVLMPGYHHISRQELQQAQTASSEAADVTANAAAAECVERVVGKLSAARVGMQGFAERVHNMRVRRWQADEPLPKSQARLQAAPEGGLPEREGRLAGLTHPALRAAREELGRQAAAAAAAVDKQTPLAEQVAKECATFAAVMDKADRVIFDDTPDMFDNQIMAAKAHSAVHFVKSIPVPPPEARDTHAV